MSSKETQYSQEMTDEVSPWTWVTIFYVAETYPVDFVLDPRTLTIKKEPLPDAVTEVHDIKVPFVILQFLSKVGIKKKYLPPGATSPRVS